MPHQQSLSSLPPDVQPEADWRPLAPWLATGSARPFLGEEPERDRLRLRYFYRERDHAVVGRAWFGPGAQGPPGHAHGGSIVAVLDEAMGAACWLAGHKVLAARLVTDFRRPVRLGTDATFEAWVERVDGRKVHGRARLHGASPDELYAEAEGLFVRISDERFQQMIDRAGGEPPGPWSA